MPHPPQVPSDVETVRPPPGSPETVDSFRNGPKGALLISAIAVGALFIGWIAFYFFLFMPRGPVG